MVNAILAAVLSFLIPGLGQAIAGDIKKGIIFFVIAIVLAGIASLIFRTWFAGIVNLLYSLFAAYDAYQMAK
jgi:TM2 domain-containing membrane protein YozV